MMYVEFAGLNCRAYRASYFGLFQSILFTDKLLPDPTLDELIVAAFGFSQARTNTDIFTDSGEAAFPRPQPATSMHRLPVAMQ